MKLAIGTTLLVLLACMPAYSQEPDKEKGKTRPPQQEEPRKQEPEKRAQPAPDKDNQRQNAEQERQQREAEKQQRDAAKQQQEARKQQDQAAKGREAEKQQQQSEKDRARQDRAQQEQRDTARQTQRDGGNRNARRIRDDDFRTHFGRSHHFHVERRDDRRFRYSGYWFEFAEPWPADWSYDDDVYVDDIDDEYYLIDPVHPGIRILVYVVE